MVRNPENEIRYGKHSYKNKKVKIKEELKPLMDRTTLDPTGFARSSDERQALCPIMVCLITCYVRLGSGIKNLDKEEFWRQMNNINYKSLVNYAKTGFSYKDIDAIERLNSPINAALKLAFPYLNLFKGFSFNIFKLEKTGNSLKMFPVSLSKHHRDENWFQIDTIKVTSDIVDGPLKQEHNLCHLLAVPHLARFVTKFRHERINASKYVQICRSCCFVTSSRNALDKHFINCSAEVRKSALGRKASRNQWVHRPYKISPFSGQLVQNGLTWKRSSNFKLLKSLCDIYADFEASHEKVIHENNGLYNTPPKAAVEQQRLLSFAYVIKSYYPEIALPQNLSVPRFRCCKQTIQDDSRKLILEFFLSLRKDLVALNSFYNDLFTSTEAKTLPKKRDPKVLQYILSKQYCDICGIKVNNTTLNVFFVSVGIG